MDNNLAKTDIMKRPQSQETRYTNQYNSTNPTVQFRSNHHHRHLAMESVNNSGEYSWPKWGNNSPSPPKSPSHPLLGRSPSSDSRARAIARGQWELMEMVRNMPESSYELSLKDMVEKNQETREDRGPLDEIDRRDVVKSKRYVSNNNSGFEKKGLFLNMVFPFSFGKKKKGKIGRNCGGNNKVLPRVDEKDWWKKRFSGSSDSSGSGMSNSSGGGGTSTTVSSRGGSRSSGGGSGRGRKRNVLSTGCWPFFRSGGRKFIE